MNTPNGLVRCVNSGLDEINEECAKRGVKLRWIAEVNSSNIEETKRLCEFAEVRHIKIPGTIRFIVVDGSETLISSIYDDTLSLTTGGDVTFWTRDKNISTFMNYLFNLLWKEAKPVSKLISKLS